MPEESGHLLAPNPQRLEDLIAIIGSYKVFDSKSLHKVKVMIYYLEPIYCEDYQDLNTYQITALDHNRIVS